MPPVRQAFRRRRRPGGSQGRGRERRDGRQQSPSPIAAPANSKGFGIGRGSPRSPVSTAGRTQEISSAATSTICPTCSVHIDLRDYKINTAFQPLIRTHGEVHVTVERRSQQQQRRSAAPPSSKAKCAANLQCHGTRRISPPAKCREARLAATVLIGKKANVQFFRRLQVGAIEIRGSMTGEIVADSGRDDSQHRVARRQRHRALHQCGERWHLFRSARHWSPEAWSQAELLPGLRWKRCAPPNARKPLPPGSLSSLPATS